MTKRQKQAHEQLNSLKESKFGSSKEGRKMINDIEGKAMSLHDFLQAVEEIRLRSEDHETSKGFKTSDATVIRKEEDDEND